jgi:hypothetical protein
VARYRIKPTAGTNDLPAADLMCDDCGKVLGVVRWRSDVQGLTLVEAVNRCPELTGEMRQHEADCLKRS